MKTVSLNLSGLKNVNLSPDPKTKWMCVICDDSVAIFKEYSVWRHHIENHQTFRTNFPEGSQERAESDWILQSELYYFHALCDVPVWYVTNFKRETMNKLILLFITFEFV